MEKVSSITLHNKHTTNSNNNNHMGYVICSFDIITKKGISNLPAKDGMKKLNKRYVFIEKSLHFINIADTSSFEEEYRYCYSKIQDLYKSNLSKNLFNYFSLNSSKKEALCFLDKICEYKIDLPIIGIFHNGRFLFEWELENKVVCLIEFLDNKNWNYLIENPKTNEIDEGIISRNLFISSKFQKLKNLVW